MSVGQTSHFQAIADGLSQAIKQGREATEKAQAQFTAIMLWLDENLKMATGGDSVCYISLLSYVKTPNVLDIVVIHRGRHPLRDVTARMVDVEKMNSIFRKNPNASLRELTKDDTNFQIGILSNPASRIVGNLTLLPSDNHKRVNIFWALCRNLKN